MTPQSSSPYLHKFRGLSRDAILGLAVLACCLAVAGGATWWQYRLSKRAAAATSGLREATEYTASMVQLGRHVVEMFAAATESSSYTAGRAERYAGAQQQLMAELAAMRQALARNGVNRRTAFLQELAAVEGAASVLMASLDATVKEGPEPAPNVLRDQLGQALGAVERLRDQAERIQLNALDAQRVAVAAHGQFEAWLTGALLALAGVIVFGLRPGTTRAHADAREKQALAEQLHATEAKYRATFEDAVEGIFQTTADGRILTANRALASIYGYRSAENLIASFGNRPMQLCMEGEKREELLRALLEDDVVSHLETEIVRADGRIAWIREHVRAIKDDEGKVLYLQGKVEDVSDRWWSEQRRKLQYATTRVLEKSESVAEARPMILQSICDLLEWDMGAVWDVNAESEVLSCVEVWHTPHIDIAEFEQAMSGMRLRYGQGLAGEVWESGEPKCIANLPEDRGSRGATIAVKNGMGSAFGVPIKVHGVVRHVAEFFSPNVVVPDPELLQMLGAIGSQLGHLVERKSAEEALRKSEMRKAAILHSALDCIISFETEGRITEFNPAAERAFGFRRTEALGKEITELILMEHQYDPAQAGSTLYTTTNPARSIGRRVELVGMRSDGSEFPAEVAISRIKFDGRTMYTAYLRDISERKEAERVTSELVAVVANSNDAIIGCTSEGTIRSWNNGAERIYGFTAEEAIGRPLQMLIPPERMDEYPRMLKAIAKGESVANYETVRLRKDGKKINVSLTDSPIRGESGRITGLSSIVRDITERRRLEEELLQSQKMEAVGRLAGGIAHDFNNILTAIMGYSDLLIGQIEERHWMYKHLSEIRKASDFAASLTQQLLAFSRRQPLYLRVFNINDTVRNLQKMLQRVIGENIKIQTQLTADVGRLKADQSQLEQVLLNLCVNARDAMPEGGTITIQTRDVTYFPSEDANSIVEMPAGEYVKLCVSDTGTGIAPEIVKHIFEPFFTTKAQGQGTGLGLATCYGIVKQSGGYISVESTVGSGTSFSIYMPRVDETGGKSNSRPEVGVLPGGSETILYVEDELAVRSLTAHVLRRLGYTVLEAGDGQQARSIVEERNGHSIDLLFSDVVLPDLSGRQLADWVCTRRQKTKLLFTSGYVDESILRRHGVEADAAFLQKPFTPSDLALKVREVMGSDR